MADENVDEKNLNYDQNENTVIVASEYDLLAGYDKFIIIENYVNKNRLINFYAKKNEFINAAFKNISKDRFSFDLLEINFKDDKNNNFSFLQNLIKEKKIIYTAEYYDDKLYSACFNETQISSLIFDHKYSHQDLLKKYKHKIVLLTAIVNNVFSAGNVIYLNFSDDYRTDFTVKILKKELKNMQGENKLNIADIDAQYNEILSLVGKKIIVKGMIKNENGPMIEIFHPSQLLLFEDEQLKTFDGYSFNKCEIN